MPRMIIVSLPVTNLSVSLAFYESLGFTQNPQCSDETAACMVFSETIQIMLLTHAKWASFSDRPIAPSTSSEVALMFSCESRDDVDEMNKQAAENGGVGDVNPIQDHGFMYGRDFTDPDGHVLGAIWMDMTAIPSA